MTTTPNSSGSDLSFSGQVPIDLRQAYLRANPAYELVLLDRLSATEREALRGLAEDPDCYGVLRSGGNSALSIKAVSRDTALLLFSLQQPGTLPYYAARTMGEACAATIAKMILDGVLEVEANGQMVSGPEASDLIFGATPTLEDHGPLAAVSHRAVEYAASLGLTDPLDLSARLYAYNCIPSSPRWRALLPNASETAPYLGLVKGGAALPILSGKWHPLKESAAWIHWQAKASRQVSTGPDQSITNYKLYVSPACDRLRETIGAVADAVASSNAIQWKVGKGLRGLSRPDKLVIYFRHFTDLQEVALKIMKDLEGCAPHGVPFTAELAGKGLLSWGIDPPHVRTVPWLERESWRSKLTNRLALALTTASRVRSGELSNPVNAARFAMHRLQLEGIDTSTWTPSPGFVWTT